MATGVLPKRPPARKAEAPAAAGIATLRQELAKALGVAPRPSPREVATAFRDGTRVIGDLRKTGAIDPAAAETLLKALTTLFVQAIILHLTEALFEPDGAIGVLRHSLVEESRR